MKPADIDPTLAQDRSDAADYTRHVVIARHEHVPMRRCLEIKTVDLGDTTFASLTAITEQCSGETLRRLAGAYLSAHRGRDVAGGANVSSRDFYATLVSDEKRVDSVHTRAHVAQQSGEKRTRHRSGIDV